MKIVQGVFFGNLLKSEQRHTLGDNQVIGFGRWEWKMVIFYDRESFSERIEFSRFINFSCFRVIFLGDIFSFWLKNFPLFSFPVLVLLRIFRLTWRKFSEKKKRRISFSWQKSHFSGIRIHLFFYSTGYNHSFYFHIPPNGQREGGLKMNLQNLSFFFLPEFSTIWPISICIKSWV